MATMAFGDEVDLTSRWGLERHFGQSWFMESMWRKLPEDILERVILFLPLVSLLRFTTVSKEWYRLINHRAFALRHARARASFPEEEYVVITVRFDAYESNPIRGWEVLDVVNKRFFTLSSNFLTEYVKRAGVVPASLPYDSWHQRAVLAADGGLFCVSYSFNEQNSVLLVCNPVLKSVKQLPHLTEWAERAHRVVMKTDRTSMQYEIFVVNDAHHRLYSNSILIYESKTGRWTKVLTVNPLRNELDFYMKPFCSVSQFVKDEFYEPFTAGHRPNLAGIVAYNKVTGGLSDLGVRLPSYLSTVINLQLVVSKERLFCVTQSEHESSCDTFIHIFEIILGKQEYLTVTEMPSELVNLVLGDALLHDPFVATMCANSILICSITGQSVAYSLSNMSWHHYPRNNLTNAVKMFGEAHQEVFGSNYCLSLCAP